LIDLGLDLGLDFRLDLVIDLAIDLAPTGSQPQSVIASAAPPG
jgi:hypothetical protein